MARTDFQIVERGAGAPLVLIPGIQGRWEYPARSSTRWRRSIASSRSRSATSGPQERNRGLMSSPTRPHGAMDRLGIERASIAGVSVWRSRRAAFRRDPCGSDGCACDDLGARSAMASAATPRCGTPACPGLRAGVSHRVAVPARPGSACRRSRVAGAPEVSVASS